MNIIHRERQLILPVRVTLEGRYRMQVYRPDGRCRHDSGWFTNIITDAGLEHRGTTNNFFRWCQVGSGTAAPVATDTALASYVAGTSDVEETTNSAESTSPFFASRLRRYRFAAGDAAGNISEVGVGPADTGGASLYSRALVVDGNGDPTTITVLADEFLDVTFESRIVPPTTDATFNVTDSGPAGTVHGVTLRACNVTTSTTGTSAGWSAGDQAMSLNGGIGGSTIAYDGAIGAITASPAGTSAAIGGVSNNAYVGSSLEKLATINFGLNEGNFASGMKSIRFTYNHGGCFQAEFDPVIPKTNTDTLAIGVKVSWARS